jgi:hypothetical protein
MPDHLHVLAEHVLEDILAIVIAITAGKYHHADFHNSTELMVYGEWRLPRNRNEVSASAIHSKL